MFDVSKRRRVCGLLLVAGAVVFVGCSVSLSPTTNNRGIEVAAEVLGLRFSFTIGGPAIVTTPNTPARAAVGFRLFEQTPTMMPPSGTMTLPSSAVGVGQRLASGTADGLPLSGSGTITFRIASGTAAELCDSAVLLSEYDIVYNSGVVAVLDETVDISREALDIIVTNDVTVCIDVDVDFAADITLGDFDMAFGGTPVVTGTTIADYSLNNDDTENIHILLPGQDFPDNRLTPGSSIVATAEVAGGNEVSIRAGRNGTVLSTAICPVPLGDNYSATATWDGRTLTCTATQDIDDTIRFAEEEEPPPPILGSSIQVPVANIPDSGALDPTDIGNAAPAPITATYDGIVYGVVGVLYDQTLFTPSTPPAPVAMNVNLSTLGLSSVSTIHMIVHSSFVPDLPNGVDMGTLIVNYAEGGAPTMLAFDLGSNTAEWSYNRPENIPVAHDEADVIYTFTTTIDSAFSYEGNEYEVSISVDPTRTISCIEIDFPLGSDFADIRGASDDDLEATYASQYVAAMTFEGTAGTPSMVGSCGDFIDDDPIDDGMDDVDMDPGDDGMASDNDNGSDDTDMGCETIGCPGDDVCVDSVCVPVGVPTSDVCPATFEVDVGVFSPSIVTMTYNRFEFSEVLGNTALCVYTFATSGEASIIIYYTPAGTVANPSGSCGGEGDVVVSGGYNSTQRTVSVGFVVSGSVRMIDPDGVLGGTLDAAVDAGVGSICPQ